MRLLLRGAIARSLACLPILATAAWSQEPDRAPEPEEQRENRLEKHQRLATEVARGTGWRLSETPHYFVLTNAEDEAFVHELERRAEAIRRVIRRDFPHPKADPNPVRVAPSTIRMFRDASQYHGYGGPGGSPGYFNSADGEIVLYDRIDVAEREHTWMLLNSMVFLEYLTVLHGRVAPWFLFGHSDYYGGFRLRDCELRRGPSELRHPLIREMILEEEHAPLPELVRMSKSEFYGSNSHGLSGGHLYAQGWSLVWFLRVGRESPEHWDPAWTPILDRWWAAWLDTRDPDLAAARGFAGVDWQAFEAAWKRFTLEGEPPEPGEGD